MFLLLPLKICIIHLDPEPYLQKIGSGSVKNVYGSATLMPRDFYAMRLRTFSMKELTSVHKMSRFLNDEINFWIQFLLEIHRMVMNSVSSGVAKTGRYRKRGRQQWKGSSKKGCRADKENTSHPCELAGGHDDQRGGGWSGSANVNSKYKFGYKVRILFLEDKLFIIIENLNKFKQKF